MIALIRLKEGFFDTDAVKKSMDRATAKALSRFGAFVRQRAKTSIRKKKGISAPGEPPHSHVGLLRRWILFAYEKHTQNVVIGPAKLNKPGTTLEALEHGGKTLYMVTPRGKDKGKQVPVEIQARPFMRPAFDIELKKAPRLWQNAMRKHA